MAQGTKTLMPSLLLSGKHKMLYDECDEGFVRSSVWYAGKFGRKLYACRSSSDAGTQLFHRRVLYATPMQTVDHINHNGLDNRRANLRVVTLSQNHMNRRKFKGASKFKGVSWSKQKRKWRARIFLGKDTFLGYYKDQEEAAKAYDKAARKEFGQFACTNF